MSRNVSRRNQRCELQPSRTEHLNRSDQSCACGCADTYNLAACSSQSFVSSLPSDVLARIKLAMQADISLLLGIINIESSRVD
eukprot:2920687-Pleurochrysis_carterae.AAC.1